MKQSKELQKLPLPYQIAFENPELVQEMHKIRQARKSFWAYRLYINTNPRRMKHGWWQKEIAAALQQFAEDLIAGLCPMLIIQAPPQHGKSIQIIEFMSWLAGKYPHLQKIFTSFSERLGIRANLRLQRIFEGERFKKVFPDFRLPLPTDKMYTRNREILEYVDQDGYFRNTTVGGAITGESLDLGIIDDPIKGRAEANSETIRDKTWEWFTDDFFTRFSEEAGLLFILTRWHIDDPAGRLIASKPENLKVLVYPAIATADEPNRKRGEALFPEHKSKKFLLARKKVLGEANFEALYQQNPIIMSGKIFKKKWFKYFFALKRYDHIVLSVDTAYKAEQHNDPSAMLVWGVHKQADVGEAYDLIDVYVDRLEYPDLKRAIIDMANKWAFDHKFYARHKNFTIIIEDKASGQSLIQEIRRETNFPIAALEPESDKLTRAHVVTPHFEAGKIAFLHAAEWLKDYITELIQFDNGQHDDQVDATTQFLSYITDQMSGTIIDDTDEDEQDSPLNQENW